MFNIIVSAISAAFGQFFSKGVEKLAKIGTRLLFMTLFLGLVVSIIDFFLQKVTSYSFSNVDPCMAHFMQVIGLFNSLGVFLQILAVGLLSKYAIRYFQDSI